MKRGRVTITDIARELKIAPSTVSRALKDHSALKRETKQAVKALTKKLGYLPNLTALNLLRKKSNTIGVIVPEITSHFFSAIITGIQGVIDTSEYNIVICLSNESYTEESVIVEKLLKMQVDGVLAAPASQPKTLTIFANCKKVVFP